jgi:hypothetical protein
MMQNPDWACAFRASSVRAFGRVVSRRANAITSVSGLYTNNTPVRRHTRGHPSGKSAPSVRGASSFFLPVPFDFTRMFGNQFEEIFWVQLARWMLLLTVIDLQAYISTLSGQGRLICFFHISWKHLALAERTCLGSVEYPVWFTSVLVVRNWVSTHESKIAFWLRCYPGPRAEDATRHAEACSAHSLIGVP